MTVAGVLSMLHWHCTPACIAAWPALGCSAALLSGCFLGGIHGAVLPAVCEPPAGRAPIHTTTAPAAAGAARLIERAKALGMAVGVGSSSEPEKIAHNLASSGLAPLLEGHPIVSAAYVARGKPAPDVYVETMARMGVVEAARALVVEDSVNGLLAAQGAGAFRVGVSNSLPARVLAPHADLVVAHLDELDLEGLMPAGQGV